MVPLASAPGALVESAIVTSSRNAIGIAVSATPAALRVAVVHRSRITGAALGRASLVEFGTDQRRSLGANRY
jgi:hypothetical protein